VDVGVFLYINAVRSYKTIKYTIHSSSNQTTRTKICNSKTTLSKIFNFQGWEEKALPRLIEPTKVWPQTYRSFSLFLFLFIFTNFLHHIPKEKHNQTKAHTYTLLKFITKAQNLQGCVNTLRITAYYCACLSIACLNPMWIVLTCYYKTCLPRFTFVSL